MKRTIKKQFWFSRDEAQDLQKKAKKTCLSEAALVRLLIRGYEPKEKPDDRFYDAMREFSAIGNNIHPIRQTASKPITAILALRKPTSHRSLPSISEWSSQIPFGARNIRCW